jgi:hypothetical protein
VKIEGSAMKSLRGPANHNKSREGITSSATSAGVFYYKLHILESSQNFKEHYYFRRLSIIPEGILFIKWRI